MSITPKDSDSLAQENFLMKIIEFLGEDGLRSYNEIQTESVKNQEQVFLLREFKEDGVQVHRIFPEETVGEEFTKKIEALVLTGNHEVLSFKFNYDAIDYDTFAELETHEGVKEYFWFENK